MFLEIITKEPTKLSVQKSKAKRVYSHVQLPNKSLTLFQANNNEIVWPCYDSFIADMIN